jgi:probable HAF family extracellular repeat protein
MRTQLSHEEYMPTNTEIRAADACWQRRLLHPLIALFGCALAALATAAPSMPPAPAPTTYRVVQLTNEPIVFGLDINAKGQVAFSESRETLYARFYDGSTFHEIGGPGVNVQAVNNLGQVTGVYLGRAFRWSLATGLVNIDTSAQGDSTGFAINEKGQIAGEARVDVAPNESYAFLWTPQTGMRNLGTLGGRSRALALNESGTVVGFSRNVAGGDNTTSIAFRWTVAEGMRPLGTLPGQISLANDVNEAGYIVGAAPVVAGGMEHAFLWTPQAGLRDLCTGACLRSNATRINDKGMVIGNYSGRLGDASFNHGFVWTREHGLVDLGLGAPFSLANDVNVHGQVVGTIDASSAYVWTRATGIVDLNTRIPDAPPGLILREARVISDNGSIVASSNAGLVLLVPKAPVSHQAPVLGPITFTGTARVNSLLSFSASFTDADRNDTHKATWSWGDGSKDTGIVSARHGSGSVSAQHVYRKAGIYTARLTITDSGGKSTTVQRTVVVCGAGAHIAGEGSIMSALDASGDSRQQSGPATFAFLSPAGTDLGQAAIQFDAPGLSLRSEQVESLRIDGARLHYKGSARVNGKSNYRFELTATMTARSGSPDRIRIRVWHHDRRTNVEVVDYDNGLADAASKGSAVTEGAVVLRSGD